MIREFITVEVAGALVLLAAAIAALAWSNAAAPGHYEAFWRQVLRLGAGAVALEIDLRGWINDLLMALFFFVVGVEIKREIVDGELREPRRAALPVVAALGGMIAPALLYLALNPTGPAARGWGVPMATDIAFAVGMLGLFGARVPLGLKVFLLTVAIADDIGAIAVIAVFYSDGIRALPLVVAAAAVAAFATSWRLPGRRRAVFLVGFAGAAWLATHESGVHATIAGVALGLAVPAGAAAEPSPAERLSHQLHPWTSFGIVPLFALANAGVVVRLEGLAASLREPVAAGVILGLVVGKIAGIMLASYAAVRAGIAALPAGVGWDRIVGASALAGIGFTVSLFIIELAYSDERLIAAAKTGVLAGSVLAALIGGTLLTLLPQRGAGLGAEEGSTARKRFSA